MLIAACPLSSEAAVMIAVPPPLAVTTPLSTLATAGALELHKTFLLVALAGYTDAVKVVSSPILSVLVVGVTDIDFTPTGFTVTLQVASISLSSAVLAVIVAVPTPAAVTVPVLSTDATLLSDDSHTRSWFDALSGVVFAAILNVSPTYTSFSVGSSETESTSTGSTFTLQIADALPSADVAVRYVVPTPVAVTLPSASTVAIVSSEVVHVTAGSVTFSGKINASICVVSPTANSAAVWLSVTD